MPELEDPCSQVFSKLSGITLGNATGYRNKPVKLDGPKWIIIVHSPCCKWRSGYRNKAELVESRDRKVDTSLFPKTECKYMSSSMPIWTRIVNLIHSKFNI